MIIIRNTDACYGCRSCQLICSYHHTGQFDPEQSSIKVNRDYKSSVIRWAIDSTCDGCKGEEEPLCVKYCVYGAIKLVQEASVKTEEGNGDE